MYIKLILFATVAVTYFGMAQCAECVVNNCQNGSTCKALTDGEICICSRPYWGKFCENNKDNKRDMTFLVGHSANPNETEWQMIQDFLDYVVSNIPIGDNASEIAIVIYSPESGIVRKLNDPNDLATIKQEISQMEDGPGPVDLAGALALLRNEIYTEANGDRSNAHNPVTFLIDGVAPKGKRVVEEAEACLLAGMDIWVNAIGKRAQANMNQLNAIAVDDRHLRKLDSYADLHDFAVTLVNVLNSWIGT